MDELSIRNLREFLLLYNKISQTCFERCTNTFGSREITNDEEQCVKNCVDKHIHANHKTMEIFMEVRPVMMQKRMEEMNNAQAALEANTQTQEVQNQDKQQSEAAVNVVQ